MRPVSLQENLPMGGNFLTGLSQTPWNRKTEDGN
jgi:hypothetical protein